MTSYYFSKKNELKDKAVAHVKLMEKNYKKEIEECVKNTIVYGGNHKNPKEVEKIKLNNEPKKPFVNIIVDKLDSVESMFKHRNGKTAILNFASYKNPGGKFIEGSSAQEECLCHTSNLYNVLYQFNDYYEWNKKHNNRALYTNRALYSKDVTFFDDSVCVYGADPVVVTADVITCAAPNFAAAGKFAKVSEEENNETLKERIKFVLDIAEENGVDTLILGAFGCGVFGQNPSVVAKYFYDILSEYKYNFKTVYFSILNRGKNDNYNVFKTIFN